ncbi:BBSome-interacting protein 1-like protein [Dinothrombium tinctorium]|uniref:BBSome-interacting protein 1-like protein n=1 Tax=Dinothrombium tinctorium TaxID=1965070 RepID=A0A443RB50_9ACAR|nr:BBSome-interacting protein 1-like protein [Dinothrombium tinctorium]
MSAKEEIKPVIPNQGIVFQEEKSFYVLCKPKLLPLKSVTLEKLERMQESAQQKARQQMNEKQSESNQFMALPFK